MNPPMIVMPEETHRSVHGNRDPPEMASRLAARSEGAWTEGSGDPVFEASDW